MRRTHRERARAPGAPAPDLVQIGQGAKRGGVTEGHVDDAVVREGAHGRQRRALLAAALRGRRDEEAGVLAVVAARLPLLARVVPKGLPLGGQVAVARRDAEQEGGVLFELVRGDEGDRGRLAGCVHFGQDLLGEGLFDSVWMKEAGQFWCFTHGGN